MNLSQAARLTGKASVYMRDVSALQRGRLLERLTNRAIGRLVSQLLRGVWR